LQVSCRKKRRKAYKTYILEGVGFCWSKPPLGGS
jgi:hypothetical protein